MAESKDKYEAANLVVMSDKYLAMRKVTILVDLLVD
jgi:hypothetical protein